MASRSALPGWTTTLQAHGLWPEGLHQSCLNSCAPVSEVVEKTVDTRSSCTRTAAMAQRFARSGRAATDAFMVMPGPVRLGAQKQAISPGRWNAQSSRAANGRAAWPLDVGQLQTRYGTGGSWPSVSGASRPCNSLLRIRHFVWRPQEPIHPPSHTHTRALSAGGRAVGCAADPSAAEGAEGFAADAADAEAFTAESIAGQEPMTKSFSNPSMTNQ